MGWYDNHIEAVANRRSEKLHFYGEKNERLALKKIGWSDEEIERIIRREKEIEKKNGYTESEVKK